MRMHFVVQIILHIEAIVNLARLNVKVLDYMELNLQSNVIMYAHVGKNVIVLLLIIPIPIIVMLTILRSSVEQTDSPMTVLKNLNIQHVQTIMMQILQLTAWVHAHVI